MQYQVMGIANDLKSLTITIQKMADEGWEIDREIETNDYKRVCIVFKRPKEEKPDDCPCTWRDKGAYTQSVFCNKHDGKTAGQPKECICVYNDGQRYQRGNSDCPKHDAGPTPYQPELHDADFVDRR